jgi:hypothetical protein
MATWIVFSEKNAIGAIAVAKRLAQKHNDDVFYVCVIDPQNNELGPLTTLGTGGRDRKAVIWERVCES